MLCWLVVSVDRLVSANDHVIQQPDHPIIATMELLTAVEELKMIEPDNHLLVLVDALGLVTNSKNLTTAKEKIISSEGPYPTVLCTQ